MNIQFNKLIELRTKGIEVFGDEESFERWMEKPAYGLGEKIPVTLMDTDAGIDLILDELTRIAHGDLS